MSTRTEAAFRLPAQTDPRYEAEDGLYRAAISALRRCDFSDDAQRFEAVLNTAIYHCERARAFRWPESARRKGVADAIVRWDAANMAAVKLAQHFEGLDELTASKRLALALSKTNLQMRVHPPSSEATHLLFARFLRELGKQMARRADGEYQIGPLRVAQPSRKLPSPATVLTLLLAHFFGRLSKDPCAGSVQIWIGEPISSGRSWEVAADFASAALARPIDSVAARKFLRDHRGYLYYVGWPKPKSV
jgi:hypothetical protein